MATLFAGHKERALTKEQPHNPRNSVIPTIGRGQVYCVSGRQLAERARAVSPDDLTQDALDAAIARMEAATSRFREATGDDFDGANLALTAAQTELRAVYTKCGNRLTPRKAQLINDLLYDFHCKLRPEYPVRH